MSHLSRKEVSFENAKSLYDLKMQDTKSCVLNMLSQSKFLFFIIFCIVSFPRSSSSSSSSLAFNFYASSCPSAELIVKNTVRSAANSDSTVPGKLLRLFFHDCFVEGCDASVLLQENETERTDPGNRSLGGFQVIDSAKRALEIFCPGTVSCADILALAARDSVEFSGGPNVEIPTGRKDGLTSSASNVRPNIIDTSFTLDQMVKVFSEKGLSIDDLAILSGAHTIGSAHCNAFNDRYKLDSNGNITLIDTSLNREYAAQLMKTCPAGSSDDSTTVSNDPGTPLLFDNVYYKILLEQRGLFQSDSALLNDERTRKRVMEFANDQDSFFENWGASFLKLSTVGVKVGDDEGEIRQSCSVTNR